MICELLLAALRRLFLPLPEALSDYPICTQGETLMRLLAYVLTRMCTRSQILARQLQLRRRQATAAN